MNTKELNILIISILLGLIAGIVGNDIFTKYPQYVPFSTFTLLLLVIFWLIYNLAIAFYNKYYRNRFSVLIFVLSNENRLLLVNHPFHKRLIPPGGRLHLNEFPNNAIHRILNEETGINNFAFHSNFHKKDRWLSENVLSIPQPFSVHIEQRSQRLGIAQHYAFVYVCNVINEVEIQNDKEIYTPKWYSLEEMTNINQQHRPPFADVIETYKIILKVLNNDTL